MSIFLRPPSSVLRRAHRLRCIHRAASDADGEAAEEAAFGRVEQVVAPGDRVAERALALRQVAGSAGQQREAALQAGEHRLRSQQLDPRGCQLDRQREAVQASADVGDGEGVLIGQAEARPNRRGALAEQGDGRVRRQLPGERAGSGLGEAQRRDRKLVLAAQVEHGAARDEHLEAGRGPEQIGHDGGGGEDLLEVVQQEQQALVAQVVDEGIADRAAADVLETHGLGDGRHDEGRVAKWGQLDEEDAVLEVVDQLGSNL